MCLENYEHFVQLALSASMICSCILCCQLCSKKSMPALCLYLLAFMSLVLICMYIHLYAKVSDI